MIIKYETKPKPKAETLFDKIVKCWSAAKNWDSGCMCFNILSENIQEALTELTESFDNMVSQLLKEMLKSNDWEFFVYFNFDFSWQTI